MCIAFANYRQLLGSYRWIVGRQNRSVVLPLAISFKKRSNFRNRLLLVMTAQHFIVENWLIVWVEFRFDDLNNKTFKVYYVINLVMLWICQFEMMEWVEELHADFWVKQSLALFYLDLNKDGWRLFTGLKLVTVDDNISVGSGFKRVDYLEAVLQPFGCTFSSTELARYLLKCHLCYSIIEHAREFLQKYHKHNWAGSCVVQLNKQWMAMIWNIEILGIYGDGSQIDR